MIGTSGKHGSFHNRIPTTYIKQAPVIPFDNAHQYRENPTIYFGSYLKTDTRNMHQVKSQTKLQ